MSSVPGRYTSALGMTAGTNPRGVMEWPRNGGTACVIVVSSVPGRYTIRIRDDRRDQPPKRDGVASHWRNCLRDCGLLCAR